MEKRVRVNPVLGACLAVLCFASVAQAAGTPPPRAATDNGAYVILGDPHARGGVDFKYGWRSSAQCCAPATAFWIGLYGVTNSSYRWVNELPLPQIQAPAPGAHTTESVQFRCSDPTANLAPGD